MTIIVLEGLDGAGKSTVAKMLAGAMGFNYRHYPVDIEKAKLDNPSEGIDFAMAVDMITHRPFKGDWVLDRYYHSHYAYGGRFTLMLKRLSPKPDYSFLIDVDPAVSLERCRVRGDDTDITLEQRQLIRGRYLELKFTKVLPGHLTPCELFNAVLSTINHEV